MNSETLFPVWVALNSKYQIPAATSAVAGPIQRVAWVREAEFLGIICLS